MESKFKVGDVVKCIENHLTTHNGDGWILGKIFKISKIKYNDISRNNYYYEEFSTAGVYEDCLTFNDKNKYINDKLSKVKKAGITKFWSKYDVI